MSDYQKRKALRAKLNNKRNTDRDHSIDRYHHDAKVLNRAMRMYKIKGKEAIW